MDDWELEYNDLLGSGFTPDTNFDTSGVRYFNTGLNDLEGLDAAAQPLTDPAEFAAWEGGSRSTGIDQESGLQWWEHPDGSVMYTPFVDRLGIERSPTGDPTGRTIESVVGRENVTVPSGQIPTGPNTAGGSVNSLLNRLAQGSQSAQRLTNQQGGSSMSNLLPLLLLLLAANQGKGGSAPSGQATIPQLSATRTQTPYSQQRPTGYRPGQGGVSYFNPVQYAAAGGVMGGIAGLGAYAAGGKGRLVAGQGDGVSDDIPARIDGEQEARIARGEYVIPARVVAELGNGSTDAGAERLDDMLDRIEASMKSANRGTDSEAYKHLLA